MLLFQNDLRAVGEIDVLRGQGQMRGHGKDLGQGRAIDHGVKTGLETGIIMPPDTKYHISGGLYRIHNFFSLVHPWTFLENSISPQPLVRIS